MMPTPARIRIARLLAAGLVFLWTCAPVFAQPSTDPLATAISLAELLRSARTVISTNQERINDPTLGDKGLTGEIVLDDAIGIFAGKTGFDPREVEPDNRLGRLLRAQMTAIRQVVDEHQETINHKGIAFKGFIPAVFGRLVTERFGELAADEAAMKVTAPPDLVRNRKALPDAWEREVIATRLAAPSWTAGKPYAEAAPADERSAFRVLVPEYYTPSCLTCHGEPKGEHDVTGYPKEGAREGDLGGVISITLFE